MKNAGRLGPGEISELYREQIAKLKAFEYPLYGLDKMWQGDRYLDGPNESQSVNPTTDKTITTRVECALVHGHADGPDQPYLRVATTTDPDATLPWRLVVRVEPTPFEERIQAITDADYVPLGASRSALNIPIDGQSAEFDVLQRGPHLVAQHHAHGYDIVLEGRGFDPRRLSLITMEDLQPSGRGLGLTTGH